MTNHTARMAALLGELRREMNGAVAESMQRGEGGYGLNYGVSIPTIRAIAGRVGTDHAFARFLYRQDVRELRMAAPTIADPASVTPDNVDECLKSFFKWSFGIVTVGIENIDILQIHAF